MGGNKNIKKIREFSNLGKDTEKRLKKKMTNPD